MRLLTSPYLFMALAMLCWAGNWLLGRAMRADVTPIGLNFWRWAITLAILLPFTAWRLPAAWPLIRQHWKLLGLLGVLGVAVFQQLVYLALEYTTAINAAIFNSTGPIVIVCISWLVFRDTISWRQAVGIALSLVGVLAIITRGDLGIVLGLGFNPGDLIALAAIPVWSLYTVLLKRRPEGLDPLVFLTVTAAVGVALMAPGYAWAEWTGTPIAFSPATVGTVVYMALFASLAAYLFWNSAVPRVGPNKAGLFLHLHPAFTTVLAIVFLGEQLELFHALGIVAIAAGIYLTSSAVAPATAAAGEAPDAAAPPEAELPPAGPAPPAGAIPGRPGALAGRVVERLGAVLGAPHLLLAAAMAMWAGNILLGRAMHGAFTPTSLSFWRWAVALGVLLPFTARGLWAHRATLAREWKLLTLTGALGVAAFNWLLYQAVSTTTATNAALIYSNVPVFIVIVSALFLHDRITWGQAAGIGISMVGVVSIITGGNPHQVLQWDFTPGDLWALTTVPVWGLYTLLLRRRPADLPPFVFQAAIMVTGMAFLAPAFAVEAAQGVAVAWDWRTAGTIAYLALFASIAAFVCWNAGVAGIGANKAGLFTHLYPLFTAVLAVLFLGEALHGFHLWGAALIFLGLYLATIAPSLRRAAAARAADAPAVSAAPEAAAQAESTGTVAPDAAAGPFAAPARALWRAVSSPYALLVLNMAFWSGNWIVARGLRDQVTPLGLNFWRWSFVLALLLPFTWPNLWAARRAIRRDWAVLLLLGGLGVGLFNLLVYLAVANTTAANGVLINSSQPVVIVLFAWLLLRERINGRQAVGIAVSLLGVLVIIARGDPAQLLSVRFNVGDLWSLASVPVWALYSVLLRRRPPELGPMALLTVLVAVGVACMLPFALWAHLQAPQMRLAPVVLGGLAYVVLFSSVLGVAFYNHGVNRLGPNVAGLFLHLVPVFVTALAWLLLGERLWPYHLGGVALIFTGIYLTTVAGREALRVQPARGPAD